MNKNSWLDLTILGTCFVFAIGLSTFAIYSAMPNPVPPKKTQETKTEKETQVWPKEVLEDLAQEFKEEQIEQQKVEEIKKKNFYASAPEVIETAYRELSDFETNLSNYKGYNPQSQIKFTYLAQANENILSIGRDIDSIRSKAHESGCLSKSPRLEQKLCNVKIAQQLLMHEYGAELRDIFTDKGIVDVPFDAEKYSLHRNSNAKSLRRELLSLSELLREEARKVQNNQ